jgi:DNA polymerase III subunit gamma/tau
VSYYQKYRPEKIADLDLESVRRELTKILGGDKIGHAYFFVGPRGSGKTSAARILARVVNCEKSEKKYQEPCGECEACKAIKKQAAVDVIEIDAASHRGIDDIRDLRERVKLAPVILRKKVYIIDEVHMLTNEAFNALLKTLEEPPAGVMFVLCTTESHKVPETIVSRCVRVIFSKASPDEIRRSLAKVVKGEKLEIEDGALELLAMSVDGSFREGHKLLEQLAAEGKKIKAETVREGLGLAAVGEIDRLMKEVEAGEVKKVSAGVMELEKGGIDALALIRECLEYWQTKIRELVMEGKRIGKFEREMVGGLVGLAAQVKGVAVPFLPIEVFLLEMAQKQGAQEVREKGEETKEKEEDEKDDLKGKLEVKESEEPFKVERVEIKRGKCVGFDQVMETWSQYLTNLTPKNHSVAGLLRSAKPKKVEDNCLIIEVFYKFHKEQLEQEVKRAMLEEEAARLWGVQMVKCVLGERPVVKQGVEKEVENISGKVEDQDVIKVAEEVFGG